MRSLIALLLAGGLVAQESRASWEARARDLEEAVRAASLDTLHLKDGRRLTGRLEEETDEALRLRGKLGSVKVPRADVARVERGPARDFLARLDSARGKVPALEALLDSAAAGPPQGRELCACLLLALDPAHARARAALDAAAPGIPAAERDVVHLKDGTRKEGVILSESASEIVLEIVLKGEKGETLGVGKASVPADLVLRVERMPEAARAKLRGRVDAFADRSKLLADALSRISLVEVKLGTLPAVRTETESFTLTATCDDQTARETAHALNQMFDAFRRHFGTYRAPARKIEVVFLAGRAQYDRYRQETEGRTVLNPASFNLTENRILAYNGVQTIEAMNVRQAIAAAERELEEARKELSDREAEVARRVRELNAELNDEAAKLRRIYASNPQADAIITREKQRIQAELRQREQALKDDLTSRRRVLNELIERNRAVVLRNQRVLVAQSRAMYETLFHETFHAFAANYLWADTDNAALPRWLHEGLATYYERSVVEAGELVHGSPHPDFLEIIRRTPLLIEEVLRAGPEVYRVNHEGEASRSNAHYAAAWSLAHFLMSRGTTKEQWAAYARASVAGDARKAFEALGGKPLAQLETDWRLHLGRLK